MQKCVHVRGYILPIEQHTAAAADLYVLLSVFTIRLEFALACFALDKYYTSEELFFVVR